MESKITKEMIESFRAARENFLELIIEHVNKYKEYYGSAALYVDAIEYITTDEIRLFESEETDPDRLRVPLAELINPSIVEEAIRKRQADKERAREVNLKNQIEAAKKLLRENGEL